MVKLVRDRIPEIISESGQKPITRQVDLETYKHLLWEKLEEEYQELKEAQNLEEIGDVIEVLINLARMFGASEEETLAAVREKRQRRGGFSGRILLIDIEPVNE